jgi:hypothetical protein
MTEKDQSLNIRLEGSLLHDFKAMCEDRGVVMSKIIRKLLMEELDKYQNWQNSIKKGNKNGGKN